MIPHLGKVLLAFLAMAGTVRAAGELTDRIGDAASDPRNPIVRIFRGERLDLWSLRPIRESAPPKGSTPGERNGIDRFIRSRLAESGLAPSPEADRRTLIRRLTMDLTGLPPEPQAVDAFQADSSPDAYERWVDRLLASPRYGEHQARLWLDVVRYSDSNGFDWDEFRPRAWRFRDYLIRSFNTDKPFDRLVREQLAGDELVAGAPKNEAEQESLLGTGYLRLGPHDNAAPLFNEQDRSRAELMADLVETTGSAFLGMTLACCRCHDHKFDPLSQADHYRMRAFFEPVKFADDLALDLEPEQVRIQGRLEELGRRVEGLQRQRDVLVGPTRERLRNERLAALTAEERAEWDRGQSDATSVPKERLGALRKRVEPEANSLKAALAPEARTILGQVESRMEALRLERPEFLHGLLMTDAPGAIPATRILFQGNHRQERQAVVPGFLSVLDPNPARVMSAPNGSTTGRRLALANWIVSPNHPLTARVFVNRVWQQHFGTGLVSTPNDFGLAGARPTHPELLDWLAAGFVRQGWSVKQLHRQIVTSATYRQQSRVHGPGEAADASNQSLWRQNPRRLSAEQLRDALLAVSGRLQWKAGGPPVWPELPPEVLQSNPAFLDDNATRTKGWYPSPADQQAVRSVFLVQKRTVRIPFLETFDLPENSTSCSRRSESIVAPQALSLLNSPLASEAARALAAEIEAQAGTDETARVQKAFRRVLARPPGPVEMEKCRELLRRRSLAELCRALLNLNEFFYLD